MKECVDRHNVILENTYNADVAATAVSVVSSNPPSKVDTQPDSKESGIFLADVFIMAALDRIQASRTVFQTALVVVFVAHGRAWA